MNAQRPEQSADPLVTTRCALSIAQVRYSLALRRASEAAPGARAAWYAEARRMLETAAELRRTAQVLETGANGAAAQPHPSRPGRDRSPRLSPSRGRRR